MGVMGSYCIVCGMPTQHDHYVPNESGGYLDIYRAYNRPPNAFPFGPEHDWLLAAVALASSSGEPPLFGTVEDGTLTASDADEYRFVADGRDYCDDYAVLHQRCWELAGKPPLAEALLHLQLTFEATLVNLYQQQLFDFAGLSADGKGWMLLDPLSEAGARNRERIEAQLKVAAPKPPPANVAELLDSNVWHWRDTSRDPSEGAFWRFRSNVTGAISREGYPELFWIIAPYQPSARAQLERFEVELYGAVTRSAAAVPLATVVNQGRILFVLYARDGDSCVPLVNQGIPVGDFELVRESDPEWKSYFEEVFSNQNAM